MPLSHLLRCVLALTAAWSWATGTQAALLFNNAFINFESRAPNSMGFTAGTNVRFGAVTVMDSTTGDSIGISGLARTTAPDGTPVAYNIPYTPGPVIPNFFQRLIPVQPDALDPVIHQPWTLTFAKGSDSVSTVVQLPAGSRPIGFVDTITVSGSQLTPTFSWTPPQGDQIHGYRINIYDRSLIGPGNNGQVVSRDIQTTSYTIDPSHFSVEGYAFDPQARYVVEISALQTRDGSANTANRNLQAISRVYADFKPVESGDLQIQLPVIVDGVFQFNFAVEAGVTYHIDPVLAIGYDYMAGVGDPFFRTVSLPVDIGDGLYELWLWNGADWTLAAADLPGGVVHDFGASGVDRFRVLGIETSAGLDPDDATAFVTSLTFVGDGQFTGTQTPITLDVPAQVPEPAGEALLLAGLGALLLVRRRDRRMAAAGR